MVKIQILSDLHMEIRQAVFDFPVKAPFLVLAGDIGDPSSEIYEFFLQEQADRFEKVFVIKGNHEHYGKSLSETDDLIQTICLQRKNLIYLNSSQHDLDEDHVLLGTTLWSDMAEDQRSDISYSLQDMHSIKDWNFDQNNMQHAKEKAWLISAIKDVENEEKLAIVVTHHSPSFRGTVAPEYRGDVISTAFCTDLESMLKLPVVCWIYAHTHFCCDKMFNGECRLISNQLGNIDESTGFDPELCVEID